MIICSITPYKPDVLKRDWGAFRQMRELCDVLIVLCDNCQVFNWGEITGGVRIDEVVELHNNLGWEDYTTRLTLLARATAHRANWVAHWDDDETLVGTSREILREQIREATAKGCMAISYDKREMWSERQYRDDGRWQKDKVIFQRNPLLEEAVYWRGSHLERLHHYPLQVGDVHHCAESRLLHWGMSSPELRAARVRKYKAVADPTNNSGYGYDYLADETGMELRNL